MKNEGVAALAAALGVSKATVSRALGHKSGVDSATREKILAAAGMRERPACEIYALLPDTPSYFWRSMRDALERAAESGKHTLSCNVYTKLDDYSSVCRYLAEAEEAEVVIAAASMTSETEKSLREISRDKHIIHLSEDEGGSGIYVGSDPDCDGRALAGLYLGDERLSALPLLVLTTSGHANRNVDARCAAFLDEVRSHGRKEYGVITLESEYMKSAKTLPSRAASFLKSVAGEIGGSFVLYSALGYARLPLAIEKARLSDKTVLICHDAPLTDEGALAPGVYASACQDVSGQAEAAYEAARACLEGEETAERIYVQSRIICAGTQSPAVQGIDLL